MIPQGAPEAIGDEGLLRQAHLVHGMGRELAKPDWPPLTEEEVAGVLGGPMRPMVIWHSPRPMSAAALVRHGGATVFVKRHHVRVRTPGQLAAEHSFITHLRTRGQPVPAVLRLAGGRSVLRRGDFCYEAHQAVAGVDVYRDAVSWSPYASLPHARSAGAALAALHLAASGFTAPPRPPAALMNSWQVISAADPAAEMDRLTGRRPELAAYLARRHWPDDFANCLAPLIKQAAPHLAALPGRWVHGDWHPSNLTWTSRQPYARVTGIFDFGLANRTSAVHDLAIALERSVVSWLDLPETDSAEADLAAAASLLDGYQAVRPLSAAEAAALIRVLPVVHLEYALSEVEYFAGIVRSPAKADLAYDGYLIGHARWFGQAQGSALLEYLAQHLGVGLTARRLGRSEPARSCSTGSTPRWPH
jgi:Ser/Thr protein kinase RdoA (MazF antagonist)